MDAALQNRDEILARFFPKLDFFDFVLEAGNGEVRWKFTFMDLGMGHEIERRFRYRERGGGVWIGKTRARDGEHLLKMIFDHYPRCRRRLDRYVKLSPT